MSIWGGFFGIEDEREWIADLQADGIGAGVIRDGEPSPEDLDAPLVYQGSNVLPEHTSLRGGGVDLAYISAHVRFWRDNPDAPVEQEPYEPVEPFMRLMVHEARTAPKRQEGLATVLLTVGQVERLRDALTEWIALTAEGRSRDVTADAVSKDTV